MGMNVVNDFLVSAVCTEPCVCVLGVVLYIHAREDEVHMDRDGWEDL